MRMAKRGSGCEGEDECEGGSVVESAEGSWVVACVSNSTGGGGFGRAVEVREGGGSGVSVGVVSTDSG